MELIEVSDNGCGVEEANFEGLSKWYFANPILNIWAQYLRTWGNTVLGNTKTAFKTSHLGGYSVFIALSFAISWT